MNTYAWELTLSSWTLTWPLPRPLVVSVASVTPQSANSFRSSHSPCPGQVHELLRLAVLFDSFDSDTAWVRSTTAA